MPQVGERRSGASETVEWNGSRWAPVSAAPAAAEPQEGALSRFFGGAMKTSPLNPMNLVRAAAHPIDTVVGAMTGPLKNASQVPGDLSDVVTNERGGGPIMGRLTSALEALKHIGGSVPLIGPAGVDAGEKIGEGDIAGGAGELAGIASGALVPKVASESPGAISAVGRGAESLGGKLKKAGGVSVGGVHVPISTLGLAEAVMRHDPVGLGVAAAPYALEYGGKGLQKLGGSLESLRSMGEEPAAAGSWDPAGPATRAKAQAAQQAARESASGVEPADFGEVDVTHRGGTMSPVEQFYADNPMGEGRTTGSFEEGPGGLSSLADKSRYKNNPNSLSILNDIADDYGHGLRPDKTFGTGTTVPEDFSFEGESTGVPGEFPPGPSAPGFDLGEIPEGEPALMPDSTGKPHFSAADVVQAQKARAFHKKFLADLAASGGTF